MMSEETRIDELIDRYLSSRASADELDELKDWLSEDEEQLRYFLKRRSLHDACNPAFAPERIDKARGYRAMQPRLRRKSRLLSWERVAVAAALITVVIGATLFFNTPDSDETRRVIARKSIATSPAVKLTLPSGEEVLLSGVETRDIIADSGMIARGDKKRLTYASREGVEDSVVYHSLNVPRGGEFFLELSDKTKIWINAETTVKYPVKFPKGERKIFIDGEAYLEVYKDSTAPFSVVMSRNEVTVLGTSFNVSSYPEMPEDRVTLVSGKVCVSSGNNGERVVLYPGEQAAIPREEGMIVKRRVDTDIYCGWKNGVLIFQDNTLEEILHVLARQYDVEIYWHDEALKQYKFSGELKRYEQIKELLKLVGYTDDVKFTVHGKKIIVAKP